MTEMLDAAESSDPRSAIAPLRRVLLLRHDWQYWAILLWAAQSHVLPRLRSVFYLLFTGGMSSGKSTALKAAIAISRNGEVLANTTPAYLATVLDDARPIGLMEAHDLLGAKDPTIKNLALNGYQRGATIGLMVPSATGGWRRETRSAYCPKAFDVNGPVHTHVWSRCVPIHMEADDSVDRTLDAANKTTLLEPVRKWLTETATQALAEWTEEKVTDHYASPQFRTRVAGLGGVVGRDHELGAAMLLTADIMGWKIDTIIGNIAANRSPLPEDGPHLVTIDALLGPLPTVDGWVLVESVRKIVNDRLTEIEAPEVSEKAFSKVLDDLHIVKGKNRLKGTTEPFRHRAILRPASFVARLAHMAHRELPAPVVPDAPLALERVVTPTTDLDALVAPVAPLAEDGQGRQNADIIPVRDAPLTTGTSVEVGEARPPSPDPEKATPPITHEPRGAPEPGGAPVPHAVLAHPPEQVGS